MSLTTPTKRPETEQPALLSLLVPLLRKDSTRSARELIQSKSEEVLLPIFLALKFFLKETKLHVASFFVTALLFLVQGIVQRCYSNTWPFRVVMYSCYHDDRTHVTNTTNKLMVIYKWKKEYFLKSSDHGYAGVNKLWFFLCHRCHDRSGSSGRKPEENVQAGLHTWRDCSGKSSELFHE